MIFKAKQMDEWVRLFGTLAAAALSGAAVGLIGMIMDWRSHP